MRNMPSTVLPTLGLSKSAFLTFLTNINHIMLYFAYISVIYVPTFHFYGGFCDFCGDFVGDFGDFS